MSADAVRWHGDSPREIRVELTREPLENEP